MKNNFLLILLFTSHFGWCQTEWYSLIPFKFHPSFAGSSGGTNAYARFQVNSSGGYKAYGYELAGDAFLKKIITGVGFSVSHFNANDAYLNNFGFSNSSTATCIIAPKFSRKEKFTFSPSLENSYSIYNYEDQYHLNPDSSNTNTSSNHKLRFYQARLGALFNTKKFFIGFHLPILNFTNEYYWLFFQYYNISSGYTFQKLNSRFSYTLVVNATINKLAFVNSNPWHVGFTAFNQFKYKFLLFGLDTQLQFMAGLEIKNFRLMITERNDAWVNNGSKGNKIQFALRYKFGGQT